MIIAKNGYFVVFSIILCCSPKLFSNNKILTHTLNKLMKNLLVVNITSYYQTIRIDRNFIDIYCRLIKIIKRFQVI